MSRRIGILTFEMPKNTRKQDPPPGQGGTPPGQGGGNTTPQRRHYLWDIKTLNHLRIYANVLKDWTRADIVELTWCNVADVRFHPELADSAQHEFVFYEKEQSDKTKILGSQEDGIYLEYIAALYFRQNINGTLRQRRIGFPAPVNSIFTTECKIDPMVGNVLADTLEQATGISPISFISGYLRVDPLIEDER